MLTKKEMAYRILQLYQNVLDKGGFYILYLKSSKSQILKTDYV